MEGRLWNFGLAAMVTRASPFLASPTVALSFGGNHSPRSSAVGNFKLSGVGSVPVGFKASRLWGSSSFAMAVVGSPGTTLTLLFTSFSSLGFL